MAIQTTSIKELVSTKFNDNAVSAGITSSTSDAHIFKLISQKREAVELVNGDYIVLGAYTRHIDVDSSIYDQDKVELPLANVIKNSFSDDGTLSVEAKKKAATFLGVIDKQIFNNLRDKRLVLMLKDGGFLLAPKSSIIFNFSGTKYKLHGNAKHRTPYTVPPADERYEGFTKSHNVIPLATLISNHFKDKAEFAKRFGKPVHSINALLKNDRKVVEAFDDGVWCLLSKITVFIDLDTSKLDKSITKVSYRELITQIYGDDVPTSKVIADRFGVGVTSVVNWSVANMNFIRLKQGGWLTAPDKLVQFKC